jgi:septal ring factor EnvC (AmiA/AmiB activator)
MEIKMKSKKTVLLPLCLVAALSFATSCKGNPELEKSVSDMSTKLQDSQKKISELESEFKKQSSEMAQLKSVVSKLGDVVVDLEKGQNARSSSHTKSAPSAAKRVKPSKTGSKHSKKRGH